MVSLSDYLIEEVETYRTSLGIFCRSKKKKVLAHAKQLIQSLADRKYQNIKPSVKDLETAIAELEASKTGKKLKIKGEERKTYLSKQIYETIIQEIKNKENEIEERVKLLKEMFYSEFDPCKLVLAEKLGLKPKHAEGLRKGGLILASERIPELQEKLKPDLQGKHAIEEFFSPIEYKVERLKIRADIIWLRNEVAGYSTKKRTIEIGLQGEEEAIKEHKEKQGTNFTVVRFLAGELGHAIVKLCRHFDDENSLSPSVWEFYDAISQIVLLKEKGHSTDSGPIEEGKLESSYEKRKNFFEYWYENRNKKSIKEIIEDFKKEENTLDEKLEKDTLKQYETWNEPAHSGGCYVTTRLIEEIKDYDISKENDILLSLARIAGKALYNPDIDFSDPMKFIESVKKTYLGK